MKRSILILVAALVCTAAAAQVRFDWNVSTETLFDNRENTGGGDLFTPSRTIFGVRLSPQVGFRVGEHRLLAGVDVMKNFGEKEGIGDLFKEITVDYSFEKKVSEKCLFSLDAGIFPRTKSIGRYGDVFFSDSLRFKDPNVEGILLRFARPKSGYELGVDWMGFYSKEDRERFLIFFSGEYRPMECLDAGISGYMYHFAGSKSVWGVVDNILVNPYVTFDAACWLPLQKLSLTLDYFQAAQQDRRQIHKYVWPQGGQLTFEVRKWNVSIRNRLCFGRDLMPYYNSTDAEGNKYGSSLYLGDPYYRMRSDLQAENTPATYDRLEAFWEPRLAPGLYFKVGAVFHFNGGFSGSNQIIAIRFDMDELRKATDK